jgi:hypothetical protein
MARKKARQCDMYIGQPHCVSCLCPCALMLVSLYYAWAVKFLIQVHFYKINNIYQDAVTVSPVLSSSRTVVLFVYLLLLISILFIVAYTLVFLWVGILVCILCVAALVLSWNITSVVNLPYSVENLECVATCIHAPVGLHGVLLWQRGNFYFIVMHITKSDVNDKHNHACRKCERSARPHAPKKGRIFTNLCNRVTSGTCRACCCATVEF